MKKKLTAILAALTLLLCACTPTTAPEEKMQVTQVALSTDAQASFAAVATEEAIESDLPQTEQTEEPTLQMMIGQTEIKVLWEDNESVAALRELAKSTPLTIALSPYGGFEQVGPIGQTLPRNDVQTTTEPGDIMLYSGNQIVVFYGSNSWSYTRLGRMTDMSREELTSLLGNGAVTITISYGT